MSNLLAQEGVGWRRWKGGGGEGENRGVDADEEGKGEESGVDAGGRGGEGREGKGREGEGRG